MGEPTWCVTTLPALTNQRKGRFMAVSNLTAARVRELLHYDLDTGVLSWKAAFRGFAAGQRAGFLHAKTGYWRIGLDGEKHLVHRVAWLWITGAWPVADIDHINGDRTDNRLFNLRSVDRRTNIENQRKAPAGSRSNLIGAQWHKGAGEWRSKIRSKGKEINLGAFPTAEAAHQAYVKAKRELHPGCTL